MRLAKSLLVIAGLYTAAALVAPPMVSAQSQNLTQFLSRDGEGGDYFKELPPPVVQPPPPPPIFIPPMAPPPATVPFPVINPLTSLPPVFVPPPTVHTPIFNQPQQIDLTHAGAAARNLPQPNVIVPGNAADGIHTLVDNKFPSPKDLKGNAEWILVRGETDAVWKRPNEYTAKLETGTILVSVRRPSQLALVETPIGDVSLHSDGDCMLTWKEDVLHIYNISALGNDCKIKFGPDVFGSTKSHPITLRTGYEVVASAARKIGRADLRPADGVARRRSQLLADGHIGVTEFSVQSVLANSAVINQIVQHQNSTKETRVLAQMSKMAAVLNAVNSPYGYTAEGTTGVASAPGTGTH